jgi:hypothetical protein
MNRVFAVQRNFFMQLRAVLVIHDGSNWIIIIIIIIIINYAFVGQLNWFTQLRALGSERPFKDPFS